MSAGYDPRFDAAFDETYRGGPSRGPACRHCGAPDVLGGTFRPVCARCVASLGRVAGDPASAHPEVIARLLDVSLDVVHLDTRIVIDPRDPWATPTVTPTWHFTSLWPTTGDARLVDGRVADGRLR